MNSKLQFQIKVWLVLFCTVNGFELWAQDTTTNDFKKIAFKFYPLPFAVTQLHGMTSEFRFGLEYKFTQHHSIQFAAAPVIPNPIYALSKVFGGYSDPYWFYGGHGLLSYRYYFEADEAWPFGWYLGGELSVNGMETKSRFDLHYPDPNINHVDWSVESKSHGIISGICVVGGYQKTIEKRKGTAVFEISGSLGYGYYYFWRKYDWGTLEFPRKEQYGFYKKVPIIASFNIAVGGLF